MSNSHKSGFSILIEALASEDLPHMKSMGRRERRAAETRLRLFRSALQLFAERGFPNVTIEDITEAADVGKGTFFNYFQSKEDVLSVMAEIQLGKLREALEQAESGKRPIQSVLHRLVERAAEEPARSPELARALISGFLASERIRQLMDGNLLEGRRIIGKIIALGQESGEIDPELKQEHVCSLFQQLFFGTMLIWSLRGKPALHGLLETNFQYLWRAIRAR